MGKINRHLGIFPNPKNPPAAIASFYPIPLKLFPGIDNNAENLDRKKNYLYFEIISHESEEVWIQRKSAKYCVSLKCNMN